MVENSPRSRGPVKGLMLWARDVVLGAQIEADQMEAKVLCVDAGQSITSPVFNQPDEDAIGLD